MKRAGANNMTVDMRGDNEYAKDQGKQYSELMAGINKAGFAAPSQIRKLERMTQLLEGIDGGRLSPAGLEAASMLSASASKWTRGWATRRRLKRSRVTWRAGFVSRGQAR